MKNLSTIHTNHPPAYLSKKLLRYHLSLSDNIIDRMITKGLLPKPLNFDGNQRWRWSDVETFIANHNPIDETEHETDEVMAGIDNVSSKNYNGAPPGGNAR